MSADKITQSSPAPKHAFRLGGILASILATVAFVLTILTVISGSKKGVLEECHSLMLNTSGFGENLIKFTPTTTSSESASTTSASSLNPFAPIESAFSGIISNITSGIDGAVQGAENSVLNALGDAIGISEIYTFHLQNICQGQLSNNSAGYTISNCTSYSDVTEGLAKIGADIPSSMTVGGTNISVPLLASVSDAAGTLNSLSKSLSTAALVLFILSLVGSGLSIPLSIIGCIAPASPLLSYLNLGTSTFAANVQLIGSILETGFAAGASSLVGKMTSSIGLSAQVGGTFMALIWVSFALLQIVNFYWFTIWFVEFRKRSYKARARTPAEIGNYKGIVNEVMSDIRLAKGENISGPVRRNAYNMI